MAIKNLTDLITTNYSKAHNGSRHKNMAGAVLRRHRLTFLLTRKAAPARLMLS
jgi:hypothetical protein